MNVVTVAAKKNCLLYVLFIISVFSRVNIGLNPKKFRQKVLLFRVLQQVMVSSRKKVSVNRTPGRGLICIFSKWPSMKLIMYYSLFMVDFIRYKCISNK